MPPLYDTAMVAAKRSQADQASLRRRQCWTATTLGLSSSSSRQNSEEEEKERGERGHWSMEETHRYLMDESEKLLGLGQDIFLQEHVEHSTCAILSSARWPFEVVACTGSWTSMCGYRPTEAIGKTLDMLQGSLTDRREARSFVERLIRDGRAMTTLVNYTKAGRPFLNALDAYVVKDDATGEKYYVTESREDRAQNFDDFVDGSLGGAAKAFHESNEADDDFASGLYRQPNFSIVSAC